LYSKTTISFVDKFCPKLNYL